MIEYRTKEENRFLHDVGNYTAYGITATVVLDGKEAELLYIPDVFLNFREALEFARRCNTYQLDPIHLMDVIDDYIG